MNKDERVKQYLRVMPKSAQIPVEILRDLGFFEVPASVKYHGAYTGGLFDPSFLVTESLVNLTEKLGLKWSKPDSPYLVGMYHDLCKCDQYVKDPESGKWLITTASICRITVLRASLLRAGTSLSRLRRRLVSDGIWARLRPILKCGTITGSRSSGLITSSILIPPI